MAFNGITSLNAQDQPQPKKDTVNMDTDAKPEVYYSVEDEKGAVSSDKGKFPVVPVVAGVLVVAAVAVFVSMKKKK